MVRVNFQMPWKHLLVTIPMHLVLLKEDLVILLQSIFNGNLQSMMVVVQSSAMNSTEMQVQVVALLQYL